jgi:alpha-1,3-glucosyltransferase
LRPIVDLLTFINEHFVLMLQIVCAVWNCTLLCEKNPIFTMEISKFAILLLAFLFKYLIGLSDYSGYNTPPMYGDYEAQRHWMEISYHLPISKWYFYDLKYWGLDYPPLTAFHSYLLGSIAHFWNPEWVALDQSRGIENKDSKYFMRLTTLATDLCILVPGIYLFTKSRTMSFLVLLISPPLQLIDHGHFQYNSAMLGFSLLAFYYFIESRYILGSIMFVSALFFKQMALFYALPVFFFLLVSFAH